MRQECGESAPEWRIAQRYIKSDQQQQLENAKDVHKSDFSTVWMIWQITVDFFLKPLSDLFESIKDIKSLSDVFQNMKDIKLLSDLFENMKDIN